MTEIIFSKKGEPLCVEFAVKVGVLAASYAIKLVEVASVHEVASYVGNNYSSNDDKYMLPDLSANDGRKISLDITFKGLDLVMSKDYKFALIFTQGNTTIGELVKTGKLTGETQDILDFVTLKGE